MDPADTFIPLARPDLGDAEWRAARAVIESGWVTQGPKVAEFEAAAAALCGASHAVAVSSGTAALHLALVAAGVGPGDEVIVPSMSYIATAHAVVHAGATPVFAEVEAATFNLDPEDVVRRLTPRTRAVVVVHQLGLPADIDAFAALAADFALTVVEDAACAIGSTYRGAPIGSHSGLVSLSFHPRKVLTTGEGGMVLASSVETDALLRRLRSHGRRDRPDRPNEEYLEAGFNMRLSDIQAAIGIEQLARLPKLLTARRRVASRYEDRLAGHPVIGTPPVPAHVQWNVQTYAVRLAGFTAAQRDAVIRDLSAEGIASRPGVMTAHREPAYAGSPALPVTERASDGSLAIPMFATMTDDQVDRVARSLVACVARAAPLPR